MKKKFITTTDEETAKKLMSFGIKLVSQIGSVYTFLNDVPQNIQFESVDTSKIVYNNKISL